MSISQDKLRSWSHQGTITKSKKTYDLIRKALYNVKHSYYQNKFSYEVYLSGSYKNSTNISESDLDVVVQLNSIHRNNLSERDQPIALDKAYSIWHEFRVAILDVLEDEFHESNITEGNKSLKIETIDELSPIDVVPCLEYRKYDSSKESYETGMTFWHKAENYQVVHFPKKHYENGVKKQKETNSTYKSTVRVFKNLRHELIRESAVKKEDSSSYFMECLLFNVPQQIYRNNSHADCFSKILDYLDKSKLEDFYQQHKDSNFRLFGDHPEQWSIDKAREVLKEMKYYIKYIK